MKPMVETWVETWHRERSEPSVTGSWVAPAFIVVALGATCGPRAKNPNHDTSDLAAAARSSVPPEPPAPVAKLGFSFEMAFPLAYHS